MVEDLDYRSLLATKTPPYNSARVADFSTLLSEGLGRQSDFLLAVIM